MSLKRKIYYFLPPFWRLIARRIYYFPIDLLNGWRGKRHRFEPPIGLIYTGSGNFIKQGKHHLKLLIEHLELKSDDHILDIGSGLGRTAVALTTFLNDHGKYEGFDVMKKGVDWCQRIHKEYPNFNFRYVPLSNDLYNKSEAKASSFKFPYPSDYFDKCCLFSVFTHLSMEEIQHYLKEIQRVLKPGGCCFATFFTYDQKSEQHISELNPFKFSIDKGNHKLMDEKVVSANIAIQMESLKNMVKEAKLNLTGKINGFWNTQHLKSDHNDFQDIIILKKE